MALRVHQPNAQPEQYPSTEWSAQTTLYHGYWEHFNGDWLDETIAGDPNAPKYPLKLNPFKMACLLHAGFLFGEVGDSNAPLVTPIVEPWGQNSTAAERDLAERMTDLVQRVWYENDGRSIQQEAGIMSQVFGGCVFGGPFFDPDMGSEGLLPIRIDHLLAPYFFPVWSPLRYSTLTEAFVTFQITEVQAKQTYDVEVGNVGNPLYQEHWTQDGYAVTVQGTVVDWHGIKLEGRPIGGFVPYTYIPHVRAGQFYGISLLDDKLEMAKEINDRHADVGDIISENARALPLLSNVTKVTERRLSTGQTFIDIGKAIPGFGEPKAWWPQSIQANNASIAWASDLLTTARIEAFTPPVCYGLDEGSQRSALTLAFRMIPLIVHMRQERTHMTTGLNQLAKRILLIAALKKIDPKITVEAVQKVKVWQDWAPILPRDREQEVNEIILRVNSNLMSPETALKRLADIRDVKTEMNLIKAWMEYQAQVQAPVQNDPFGGSSTNGQLAGTKKPKKPQANISKEEK